MSDNHDYADAEVKGLARYTPKTKLSQRILLALVPTALAAVVFVFQYQDKIGLQSATKLELGLSAIVAGLTVATFLLLLVLADTFVYLSHRKHRRITTFTNKCNNLVWWHYVLLLIPLFIGIALGKFT